MRVGSIPHYFQFCSFVGGNKPIGSQAIDQATTFRTRSLPRLSAYKGNGMVIMAEFNVTFRTLALNWVSQLGFCAPMFIPSLNSTSIKGPDIYNLGSKNLQKELLEYSKHNKYQLLRWL